ncbi:MAG: hypothetical protein NW208_07715 [Bryobacter sp.]|nr:hypothetical protein [Bryobacter sp.]
MRLTNHLLLTFAATVALSTMALPMGYGAERFDHLVRNDFFAGFQGDQAALNRGLEKTAAILAQNPQHAEAMVWHGTGLFYQSGQAFRTGDQAKGMELYGKGIGMMKQAVALDPRNPGVRIPRGSVLLSAARSMPPQMAEALRADGLSDFLTIYDQQKGNLAELGEHPRGELLLGIADSYSRMGETQKAEEFFLMIQKLLPEKSPYAKSAALWLEKKEPLPARQAGCFGCHTAK